MPDSRGSGLLRYDANTFRPLQSTNLDGYDTSAVVPRYLSGQELTTTFPRVSANRASYFSAANHLQEDAVNGMSVVPLTPPYATAGYPPFYTQPVGQLTDASFVDTWEFRLQNNDSIGVHRFAAMLTKIPAIIVGSIAAWILFGRGQANDNINQQDVRTQQEFNAALAAFVTSCVVLLGVVFAAQNHNYSHKRAYSQAIWRVTQQYSSQERGELPACYPLNCFSKTERIANLGVMLGFSACLALLSVFCVFFGLQAISQLEKDKKFFRRNFTNKLASGAYANPIPVTDKY
uniref:Uncharacterized protein n=1 Tax=Ditylenchus dipsaci TaxID=166011 RepID=A0A915CQ46_9BILA